MKKLILFATALVIASGTGAYAQSEHSSSKHRRLMNSHARMQQYEPEPGITYRSFPPAMIAPQYGYYGGANSGYGGYGGMDDPSAEGRTSG
jgi:hypothetical protein